jgi:hypothetical protein
MSASAGLFIEGPEIGGYECFELRENKNSADPVNLKLAKAEYAYGGRSLIRVAEYIIGTNSFKIQFAPVGLGRDGGYYTSGSDTNYFTPYLMTKNKGEEFVELDDDNISWSSYIYYIDRTEKYYKHHSKADFRIQMVLETPEEIETGSLGSEEMFCYKTDM